MGDMERVRVTEDTPPLIRAVDLVVAVMNVDRYEASRLLEELKVDVELRPSSGGWRVKLLRQEDALKLVRLLASYGQAATPRA